MTTLTVDAHRERLVQALDAGRPYEFLTLAEPYLDIQPADHFVRVMAVREYLNLGLVSPARELLDVASVDTDWPAELDAVRASLSSVSDPEVNWSSRSATFEANLAAMSGRGFDAAVVRDAWRSERDRYRLFRDGNGVDQVRVRDDLGHWHWAPGLADHRVNDEAVALPADVSGHMPGPYLFDGLGRGGFFRRVHARTRNTYLSYSCAIFVVESDLAALAALLHLEDWAEVLSDPRVLLFLGVGATEHLQQAWEQDVDLPIPTHAFTASGWRRAGTCGAVEVVHAVAHALEGNIERSRAQLELRYASRDGRYWAKRFSEALDGNGPPLRVLAAVSMHTTFLKYSMRDTQRALESMGHRCVVLTEAQPFKVIGPLTYHQAIRDLDPDLFLIIDHLRPSFEHLIPTNLPVLCWDQDQLPQVFTRENMIRIGPFDFVAGYAKPRCVLAGCNPKQIIQARVPTCPEQFSGEPLSDAERDRYGCDVSYVSHASQTPRAFHEEERAVYQDDGVRRLLDRMYELVPSMLGECGCMTGTSTFRVLRQAARDTGLMLDNAELESRLSDWYLWRIGDRIFRHQALDWVAAWARRNGRSFRIYGNGWDKHPTLSEFAAGPARNGRELLCIYRASRINLQLMPAGFVHQRSLDGLAAGGFFLSRRAPSDLQGRTLRRLVARIGALGIDGVRALVEHPDPELRTLVETFLGDGLEFVNLDDEQLFIRIMALAETVHPDEVFPDFEEVLFDAERDFCAKADRFLADDTARRTVSEAMRRVVVDHFSYRPTIERFLTEMAAYLRETFV